MGRLERDEGRRCKIQLNRRIRSKGRAEEGPGAEVMVDSPSRSGPSRVDVPSA